MPGKRWSKQEKLVLKEVVAGYQVDGGEMYDTTGRKQSLVHKLHGRLDGKRTTKAIYEAVNSYLRTGKVTRKNKKKSGLVRTAKRYFTPSGYASLQANGKRRNEDRVKAITAKLKTFGLSELQIAIALNSKLLRLSKNQVEEIEKAVSENGSALFKFYQSPTNGELEVKKLYDAPNSASELIGKQEQVA